MSKWGVIVCELTHSKHVAPTDDAGAILTPHVLDTNCCCKPMLEKLTEPSGIVDLIIHNDPERGGYNS